MSRTDRVARGARSLHRAHDTMSDGVASPAGDAPERVAPMCDETTHRTPVGHLLRRVYHRARDTSAAMYRGFDITPEQAAALFAVQRAGSLSQARISEAIAMEPANVSGLVRRLNDKGLIEARRDPADPRRMRIRLTPHGETVTAALRDAAKRSEAKTLSALSPREQNVLVTLLTKMVRATQD